MFRAHESEIRKHAILRGIGVSIIEEEAVISELAERKLRAVPLPGLPLTLQWNLIIRRDHPLEKICHTFCWLGRPVSKSC